MEKGNPQKENGYISIATEIVEVLAKTQLSGYESRILWAIWRKTWGWGKKEDWISGDQLENLTGIKRTHVVRTITNLVSRKIITKNGTHIGFNKKYIEWVYVPKLVHDRCTKNGTEVYQNRYSKVPKMVHTIDTNTIDTNTINIKGKTKKIENQENGLKVLQIYNSLSGKNLKVAIGIANNADFWLTHYTLEDIEHAFEVALADEYWRKIITPEIMLRRKNPRGEAVDWIGTFSAKWKPKTKIVNPYVEEIIEHTPEQAKRIQQNIAEIRNKLFEHTTM